MGGETVFDRPLHNHPGHMLVPIRMHKYRVLA
jgi:hypothetical protein